MSSVPLTFPGKPQSSGIQKKCPSSSLRHTPESVPATQVTTLSTQGLYPDYVVVIQHALCAVRVVPTSSVLRNFVHAGLSLSVFAMSLREQVSARHWNGDSYCRILAHNRMDCFSFYSVFFNTTGSQCPKLLPLAAGISRSL
eukprot:1156888-Pelagomonas_calceolata.AAC.10